MNKIKISVILFALLVIGGAEVNALPTLINSFHATNVWGNQAPPEYALRLDGFFDGNSSTEVTFGFDNVLFDQFDDGTARLHGVVSVVEYNGSTVNSFVGLSYDLTSSSLWLQTHLIYQRSPTLILPGITTILIPSVLKW